MFPEEIWNLILNRLEPDRISSKISPSVQHVRCTSLFFSRNTMLRTLAYLYAPSSIFVANLRLGVRFLINQDAFYATRIVSLRSQISTRTGSARWSFRHLYNCLLDDAESTLRMLCPDRQADFLHFLFYCMSPLAICMKVHRHNYLYEDVREYRGVTELREDLMRVRNRIN